MATDRLLKLLENGRRILRGFFIDEGGFPSACQDRDDTLVYTLDYAGWLGPDTISSVSVSVEGCSETDANDTTTVTLTISAVGATPARVTVQITTAAGALKTDVLHFYEAKSEPLYDYRVG